MQDQDVQDWIIHMKFAEDDEKRKAQHHLWNHERKKDQAVDQCPSTKSVANQGDGTHSSDNNGDEGRYDR